MRMGMWAVVAAVAAVFMAVLAVMADGWIRVVGTVLAIVLVLLAGVFIGASAAAARKPGGE